MQWSYVSRLKNRPNIFEDKRYSVVNLWQPLIGVTKLTSLVQGVESRGPLPPSPHTHLAITHTFIYIIDMIKTFVVYMYYIRIY